MQYNISTCRNFTIRYYEHKPSFPSKVRKTKPKTAQSLQIIQGKLFNNENKFYKVSCIILHSTKVLIYAVYAT